MKNLAFILMLFCAVSCKSQTIIHTVQDAKKLEINKKEFIGKPLKYFLSHVHMEVKSIIPSPNKSKLHINRISFLFVDKFKYKNAPGDLKDKPTRITVIFNQNWDLLGERCTFQKTGCTDWTKEDEQNLGDLMVYDIYVTGKN